MFCIYVVVSYDLTLLAGGLCFALPSYCLSSFSALVLALLLLEAGGTTAIVVVAVVSQVLHVIVAMLCAG